MFAPITSADLIQIRFVVETAAQALVLERELESLGAAEVDVDPRDQGLLDPLSLRHVGRLVVSGALPLAGLTHLVPIWWSSQGCQGAVIDHRSPIVQIVTSASLPTSDVAVIGPDGAYAVQAVTSGDELGRLIGSALSAHAQASITFGVSSIEISDPPLTQAPELDRAVSARPSSEIAEASTSFGAVMAALWRKLLSAVEDEDEVVLERVRDATLLATLDQTMVASTTVWRGHYTVRINAGMFEALRECASIVATGNPDPTISGEQPVFPPLEPMSIYLANVLGWMTSVARCPNGAAIPTLPTRGQHWATGVMIGASLFILAHELAHVMEGATGGGGTADSHARELRADARAIEIVRRVASAPTDEMKGGTDLDAIQISTDLTVPAAAVFFCFEGVHQRARAGHFADLTVGDNDLLKATESVSHPSPYARLEQLRRIARAQDLDGSELEGISWVASVFDAVAPQIWPSLPNYVPGKAEVEAALPNREDLQDRYWTPGMTWDEMFSGAVADLILSTARNGMVSDSDLSLFTEMATVMPQSVINTLSLAALGQLIIPGDVDPDRLRSVGVEIAGRVEPLALRLAVSGRADEVLALAYRL